VELLRLVAGWVALAIITLLAAILIYRLIAKQIDLSLLLGDKDGDASMGRFQLLIFTFVIALSFIYIVTLPGTTGFPDVPGSVLTLMGISGSSFLVSKGIDRAS
jgi:uncharacterized BrkB/YihY/UPF0761 family membrane protein